MAESNAILSNLEVSSGTLNTAFAPKTFNYTMNVENSIRSIKIKPTVRYAGSTVTVNNSSVSSGEYSSDIALNEGGNTSINITVTAQDGSTNTYNINIVVNSKITYDGNGNTEGIVPLDNTDHQPGDTVTVLDNTGNLQKTGYIFAGWNTKIDGTGQNYDPTNTSNNTFTAGNSDVILYAKWILRPSSVTATTPASVTIKGTEQVGNTLEAELLDSSKTKFTTSGGVTYEWERLEGKTATSGEVIGNYETYTLANSDENKYIAVIASYGGQTFKYTTGQISGITSTTPAAAIVTTSPNHRHHQTTNDSTINGDTNNTGNNAVDNSGNVKTDGNQQTQIGIWSQDPNSKDWKYIVNGKPATGWQNINGTWYSFDKTGTMETGWKLQNGTWYLLNDDGAMKTGWAQVNGIWYYLNDNGSMATDWVEVNGNWYYLYGDGSMATNTTIYGYTVDENGVWIQ